MYVIIDIFKQTSNQGKVIQCNICMYLKVKFCIFHLELKQLLEALLFIAKMIRIILVHILSTLYYISNDWAVSRAQNTELPINKLRTYVETFVHEV
jgi:hypothetical protein